MLILRYANYLQLDAGGTQLFYESPGYQVEPLCQLCQLYIKTLLITPFLGFPLFSLYAGGDLRSNETLAHLLQIFFLRKYYRYRSSDPELALPTFI